MVQFKGICPFYQVIKSVDVELFIVFFYFTHNILGIGSYVFYFICYIILLSLFSPVNQIRGLLNLLILSKNRLLVLLIFCIFIAFNFFDFCTNLCYSFSSHCLYSNYILSSFLVLKLILVNFISFLFSNLCI